MNEPKIVKNLDICGGRPIIDGTRIKVSQIALEFEYLGMSPDEIVQAHPHLTLPQIHIALSYYYQNLNEIKKEVKENKEFIEQLKKDFFSKTGTLQYA